MLFLLIYDIGDAEIHSGFKWKNQNSRRDRVSPSYFVANVKRSRDIENVTFIVNLFLVAKNVLYAIRRLLLLALWFEKYQDDLAGSIFSYYFRGRTHLCDSPQGFSNRKLRGT